MADVCTRFKAFLEADASIAAKVAKRVHRDHVPEKKGAKPIMPFVWFRKRQTTNYATLDSAAGEAPKEFALDVECVGYRLGDAQDLAELVRSRCNCYRGAFGDSTVQGIFVNDQDDDYQPFSTGGDDGLFVAALDLQVFV